MKHIYIYIYIPSFNVDRSKFLNRTSRKSFCDRLSSRTLCTILKISRKNPRTTVMFIDDEAGLNEGDGTFACRGIVNATSRLVGLPFESTACCLLINSLA